MKRVWQNGRVVEVWDHRVQKEPKMEAPEIWDTTDNKPNPRDFTVHGTPDNGILREPKLEKNSEKNEQKFSNFEFWDNNDDYYTPPLNSDQEAKPEPIPPKLSAEDRKRQYDRLAAKYKKEMMAVRKEEKAKKFEEPKVENPNEIPKWRPNINKIKGYLLEDSADDVDDDCDMTLGTSLLFDKPWTLEYASNQARQEQRLFENRIISHFTKNPHPKAIDMQQISELLQIPYSSVFKIFENQRKKRKYTCRENDACHRIRGFLARESEEIVDGQEILEKAKKVLMVELERHLASEKPFSIGYLHVIMEKVNLPPAYIRDQFFKMSKAPRKEASEPKTYPNAPWIPPSALKGLETEYLHKKYKSANKEWSKAEIDGVAKKLRLHPTSVLQWISKRDHAQHDLEEDPNVTKVIARMSSFEEPKPVDTRHIQKLNEHFERNSRPAPAERWLIAKQLGIEEQQVRDYFVGRRNHLDLKETREAVRREFRGLERVWDVLEMLARKPRKPVLEYRKIARELNISIETLQKFLDLWKTTITEKQK